MQVELWLFPLDYREPEPVKMGGEPMDRGRALFRALLPPGDETYTAAAIVRRYYPRDMRKKTHPTLWREYEVQHRALNRLMRDSIHYANPDNADPETGELPDGKFQGKQARAWTRQTWLKLLSDDVYEWLAALRADIERRLEDGRVRIFMDLRTFEISEETCEEIPTALPSAVCPFVLWRLQVDADLDKQCTEQLAYEAYMIRNQPPPSPHVAPSRSHAPRFYSGLAVAVLVIGFILWPRPQEDIPKRRLSVSEYILADQEPALVYATPPPATDKAISWQSDISHTMIADAKPPTTFLSDTEPWF